MKLIEETHGLSHGRCDEKHFTSSKTSSPLFFGKIIFYTCDLHLKLDNLNPLNIIFYQMVKKMNPLPRNPISQNFKTLKFLFDLIFYQVHPMNMYFHRRGHFFVLQKKRINCMTLCIAFDSFKKMHFRHLITLVYRTQNEIYILSKLF
jgi:hypothetical protein